MKKACWLMVFVLTVPVAAQTTTTAPATAPASPDALIRQLGADDWTQREAAQKDLVRLGSDVLVALRDLSKTTTDEEVRQRAAIVIWEIEDQQLIGQSLVTLDMMDAPAEQVFAEIARQCFARMPLEVSDEWRAAAPRLTVKAVRKPFWEVLRPLCSKAKVHPEWRAGRMVLAEGYKGELDGPAFISGPFLVLLTNGERSRNLVPGRAANRAERTLSFTVFSEPKIHLLNHPANVTLKRGTDDLDRRIQPMQRHVNHLAAAGNMFTARLPLNLEPDAESLLELTGEMALTLVLHPTVITIDKPLDAKPQRSRIGGQDVVIGPTRLEGNSFIVSLECAAPVPRQFTNRLIAGSLLKILDAQGRSFRSVWSKSVTQPNGSLSMDIRYEAPEQGAEPVQIIFTADSGTRDARIEFEYKGIPLP